MPEFDLGQQDDEAWAKLRSSLDEADVAERSRVELLLKEEFDQAWNHYRQMETARSQHLGFLFAALFVFAPILKSTLDLYVLGNYRIPLAVLVGASYTAIALFVLFVVRRSNAVRVHYDYVLRQVRRVFYGQYHVILDPLLDPRRHPAVVAQRFRISRAAEYLCLCVVVGVPISMIALSLAAALNKTYGWPKYLAIAGAVLTAAATTIVLWRARDKPSITPLAEAAAGDGLAPKRP